MVSLRERKLSEFIFMQLKILEDIFTIHRWSAEKRVLPEIPDASFFSFTKTDEEISLVAPHHICLQSDKSETGWACIKIMGVLDFNQTGIISGISGVLSDAGISIFAVSTYDTDYIFVKNDRLQNAITALNKEGYKIIGLSNEH